MEEEVRPPLIAYEQIAKMIDHSLLRPELTDSQVVDGCKLAIEYNVANVTVRPSDADLAVGIMKDSGIPVGSVVGFPHGSNGTAVKLYETRDLLRRGVKEIDMVINIGKMLSRQFHYIESELFQMVETCHEQGAILKVIFENAYLTDELKIIACKICKRTGVDFSKTSTGFAPSGATIEDLRLMYKYCAPAVQVKAAGGVRDLAKAIQVYETGATRFGATATAAILDAWKGRLATQTEQHEPDHRIVG